jgi:hypothetical protein
MIESPMMESEKGKQKPNFFVFQGDFGISPFRDGRDPERNPQEKRWTS